MHHKKRSEKRHKCLMDSGIRVEYARLVLSTMTRSARAVHYRSMVTQCSRGVRTADASACGRRFAVIVGSADCQRTDFFLFRGRDHMTRCCDHNEYSVKILHVVRSAITAIAELLAANRYIISADRSVRSMIGYRHDTSTTFLIG